MVSIQVQGRRPTKVFHLDQERAVLEMWLSDYFGLQVQVQQNSLTGFPDDTDSPGPTVISTATIETVASWFPVFASRFNHFYRLSVNTRIPPSEAGKILQIGDKVKILRVPQY